MLPGSGVITCISVRFELWRLHLAVRIGQVLICSLRNTIKIVNDIINHFIADTLFWYQEWGHISEKSACNYAA